MRRNDRSTATRGWGSALAVYGRRRVLIMALLGFSAGLPLALSGTTLSVWLAERAIALETIGLLSLAGLPYAVKFLWAPLVDALDLPVLSRWLGRRRGWLLGSQLVLLAAIVFLGTRDPVTSPLLIGLGAMMVAAASATQDIVIDALRIETLAADEQAAGMASYVAAYRIGMLASGAGVIALVAWLEARGLDQAVVWPIAYVAAAALLVFGMLAALAIPAPHREPASVADQPFTDERAFARVARTAAGAFADFRNREAILVLGFVLFFKLADALAGVMTGPFVLSLGYDKATYAAVVKGVGLLATLAGGFTGGVVAGVMPMAAALWLAALLQAASNLVFVWLAGVAPSTGALTGAILAENFAGGIGTVIFVAYLSALCARPGHTATQFALLTAFASIGRTVIGSGAGYAAVILGWPLFFMATTAAALPGLALLACLQRCGHVRGLASPTARLPPD